MNSESFVLAAGPNPDEWLRRLRVDLPRRTGARDYFERALAGCPISGVEAAHRGADAGLGGAVCVALYFGHAGAYVLRSALDALWAPEDTYRQLNAAFTAAGVGRDVLRRAAYRLPPGELPADGFTVWRYARTPTQAMALSGSWSTYRLTIIVEALREASRFGVPVFVARRTVDRLEADTILAYWPAWSGENPWAANEMRFDAAPAGSCVIEDASDHVDLAAEWLAMAADPRMRSTVTVQYRGGPDLPAWGAEAWRVDAAARIAWLRANPGRALPRPPTPARTPRLSAAAWVKTCL